MLRIWALLLVTALACAPAAWAEPPGDLDPKVIRQQLDGLRMLYTDRHPDVILLQRKLKKAEEIKRRRESRKSMPRGQTGAQPPAEEDAARPSAGPSSSTDTNG